MLTCQGSLEKFSPSNEIVVTLTGRTVSDVRFCSSEFYITHCAVKGTFSDESSSVGPLFADEISYPLALSASLWREMRGHFLSPSSVAPGDCDLIYERTHVRDIFGERVS